MAKEKLDKFTTLINAFKVASDELSKLNLDTNDNGVEIKKDEENADKAELTSGQKSLVWEDATENDQAIDALASALRAESDEIEKVYDNVYSIEDSTSYGEYFITDNKATLREDLAYQMSVNLEDYIEKVLAGVPATDLIRWVDIRGGEIVIEGDELIHDYLDRIDFTKEVDTIDYNGKTWYYYEK